MFRCGVSRPCWNLVGLFACVCVLVGLSLLSAAPEQAKKYALLVGVNEHDSDSLPKLGYAVNDVAEMHNVLAKAGYEVVLLTADEAERKKDQSLKPTKDNIENQLKTLVKQFAKGDTLLIGLAGHGLQFEKDGDSYFCPVDARPFKNRTDTLVSIQWIYERLEQDAASGVKLLLVDACRNDPDKGRGRGLDADTVPVPPKGVGVLLSCAAGQRSFEREKYKHGVFFHYVLEGLKGEAKDRKDTVTWDSLRSYVKEHVALDQDGQTPEESGRLAGIPPVLVRLDVEKMRDDTVIQADTVLAKTSLGNFKIKLHPDKAPTTVANFMKYVDDKFYDGLIFHRVIPDFMIQGGGLGPDMKEKKTRPPIKNESSNGLKNERGTIAMARTVEIDSGTSQFYINVKDNSFLDRDNARDKVGYCVFGKVIEGMDVVDKIVKVPTGDKGQHKDVPVQPVVIYSIRRVSP